MNKFCTSDSSKRLEHIIVSHPNSFCKYIEVIDGTLSGSDFPNYGRIQSGKLLNSVEVTILPGNRLGYQCCHERQDKK